MLDVKNIATFILAVLFLIMVYLFSKTKKPIKYLFISSICGIIGFVAINLLSDKIGFSIGYNFFTAGTTVILGVPGVVLMILLKAMMPI